MRPCGWEVEIIKCMGFTINLKDDPQVIEQYKAYHEAVWPEVLEEGRKKGLKRVKIFLLGRRLFMYLEASDDFCFSRVYPQAEEDPRCKEWDALMRSFQEKVPEARPDEWWAEMELVHEVEFPDG
jgi:L-rhamnose mutarotase